jgi:hypothetical protein
MTSWTANSIRDNYFAAISARPIWQSLPTERQEQLKANMRAMRRECLIAAKERGYPAVFIDMTNVVVGARNIAIEAGAAFWTAWVETKVSTIEQAMLVLCELTDSTSQCVGAKQ